MGNPKPNERRPEFDAIASGWGSDGLDDLSARLALLAEFWRDHFPLTAAEYKMAKAMTKRLCDLAGIDMPVPN